MLEIPSRICPLCQKPITDDDFKEVDGPIAVVHQSCYEMMEENTQDFDIWNLGDIIWNLLKYVKKFLEY